MQSEINRIQTLIQETANGNNWTGINTQQILKDISAEIATKKINDKHLNIAELTAHLTCWNYVITKRLDGENYEPAKDEDFPTIHSLTETEWQTIQQNFIESFDALIDKLSSKEDAILDLPMFAGSTSAYRNLHGQISHLHYHLAQVMLLKKLLS